MKPKEIREMSIKDLRERIESPPLRTPQRSERQERTSPACSLS